MDATTLARVKARLLLQGTSEDAVISTMITSVSAQIERYLGLGLEKTERTEQFDVEWNQAVYMLTAKPVDLTATFEIRLDATRAFGSSSVVSSDSYYVKAKNGRVQFDSGLDLDPGPGVLRIQWTGGFGTSAADLITNFPDIAEAADMQVGFLFQRRRDLGITAISSEGGSVNSIQTSGLLDAARDMLKPYRRR